MTAVLFLTALLASQDEPLSGPLPGSTPEFSKTVYAAVDALNAGRFDEAAALANKLPHKAPVIKVDTTSLSESEKVTYAEAVDGAIKGWETAVQGLKFKADGKPDILITFKKSLPPDPETKYPKGLVLFTSDEPGEPRIEAVIATTRLNPPVSVEAGHIRSEVMYAIGQWIGLADQPKAGSVMYRVDTLAQLPPAVDTLSRRIAPDNFVLGDRLRQAAAAKQKVELARPEIWIEEKRLDVGRISQGDQPITQFTVVNRSQATLQYSVRPDCGCFALQYNPIVGPGQSTVVTVGMDSTLFPGKQRKKLVVYSNDPERATTEIEFLADVTPAYEVWSEDGTAGYPLYMDQNGGKTTLYFTFDPDSPFTIQDAKISGAQGSVEWQAWEGKLPDARVDSDPKKGYKIDLSFLPVQVPGRTMVTLTLVTDRKAFETVHLNVFIQNGIAVQPASLYWGQIEQKPNRAFVILSRPGKEFTVKSVTTSHKSFTAKTETMPSGDIKLIVEFNGDFPIGQIAQTVTVETDDPEYPKLTIPITGVVR